MAEIFLVRHGQASYGAADYDRLSELGERQSRWLGEHFAERGIAFDRFACGTLRRHVQTLDAILEGMGSRHDYAQDAGLNEYDAQALLAARYGSPGAAPQGADRREHFRRLREALYDWADGTLAGSAHEPFSAFHARVTGALETLRSDHSAKRLLVVSSGGPISTLVTSATGMPARMMVELNLRTRNAAFTEFHSSARGLFLASFNNVPHLDRPDRAGAVTYA